MNADSYYEIGYSHRACEDYALHGVMDSLSVAYTIICDGCSSSSRVDVGARLVAHHAESFLRTTLRDCSSIDFLITEEGFSPYRDALSIIPVAAAHASGKALNIGEEALDTTLLIALRDTSGNAAIFCYGDGHFMVKDNGGCLMKYSVNYDSGAPFYPSYQLNIPRRQGYVKQFGHELVHVSVVNLTEDLVHIVPPSRFVDMNDVYAETCRFFSGTSQVIICSDGVGTYKEGIGGPDVFVLDICKRIADFKNLKGEFLTRKMNRLKRDFAKEGVIHVDDVGVGAIA